MATKFQGTQSFQRQTGDTLSFEKDGSATHTVTWRGPLHKLTAFRGSVPTTSPDFPTLKISRPPNEVHEGPYVRVTAIYGGTSEEISANYPLDIDNDDPDIPTTSIVADFQQTSVVLDILGGNGGYAQFQVDYRQPINTFTYSATSKPTNVSKRSRSGIDGEVDPKILQVTRIDEWSDEFVKGEDEKNIDLIVNKYNSQWEVKTLAKAFSRSFTGTVWRVSETWAKDIVQVNSVESD